MDDGWIFPYPMCGDGVTEKAQATSCWNSWGKRDTCAPGKSGAHKGKARRIRKAAASTEKLRAGFQEKLLALTHIGPYRKWTHMGKERILR